MWIGCVILNSVDWLSDLQQCGYGRRSYIVQIGCVILNSVDWLCDLKQCGLGM